MAIITMMAYTSVLYGAGALVYCMLVFAGIRLYLTVSSAAVTATAAAAHRNFHTINRSVDLALAFDYRLFYVARTAIVFVCCSLHLCVWVRVDM